MGGTSGCCRPRRAARATSSRRTSARRRPPPGSPTRHPPAPARAWAEEENFQFGLLADFWPHGAVAREYGVLDEDRGVALRGTFVIDKAGIVRWKVVNPIPQARDIADYQKALAALA